VAILVSVTLGGCASAGASGDPISATPTVVPSYAVPTELPEYPLAARESTPEAALLGVAVFFDLLNYSYATPDAAPLRDFTDPMCFTCQRWVIEVQNMMGGGARNEGGNVIIDTAELVGGTPGDAQSAPEYSFAVSLFREAGEQVSASAPPQTLPEGAQNVIISMRWAPEAYSEITQEIVHARWYVTAVNDA